MAPNVANNEHSQKLSWTLENLLYINKTIKDIHSVNITLLQSAERYRTEGLNMRGYEITFPSSLWYNIGASNNAKLSKIQFCIRREVHAIITCFIPSIIYISQRIMISLIIGTCNLQYRTIFIISRYPWHHIHSQTIRVLCRIGFWTILGTFERCKMAYEFRRSIS